MKNVLICGGAGYIGSHMVKLLAEAGYDVTTFDNLSTGHREAVKWGHWFEGDLLDTLSLEAVFRKTKFDAVIHFAARSLVGESMVRPSLYYQNNVVGTFNLLEKMVEHGVPSIVFSSTAAVYGEPQATPIHESHPILPINPYGRTKAAVETMLRDYAAAYRLRSVSLRYFNAAGADPEGSIGESHQPETHLIPNVLRSLLETERVLQIFGDDYPTPDGTCVRDYIHVSDLCDAHLLALDYLDKNEGAYSFNLGNGQGFSILEVIRGAEEIVGKPIAYTLSPRRPGDPAVLVADSQRARSELRWRPRYTDIREIIETAWQWHRNPTY